MNDPQIAAALRARDPDAIAAIFDAYAEPLFQYCWLLLRGKEAAEIAVRDTLVVAAAHAERLRDPDQLRPWLYALARAECRRRRPVSAASADEPPARPSQPDADSRVVAWNAVTSMSPEASEVLDLSARHEMTPSDAALVLDMTRAQVSALLDAAKDELNQSLGAQLIVRRVGFDCSGLTAAVRGWAGIMTPEVRDRVLAHARGCEVCGPHIPRSVSAARVYGLLPAPLPEPGMRGEMLAWLADPTHAGYRDFAARRAVDAFPVAEPPAVEPPAVEPPAASAAPIEPVTPAEPAGQTAPATRGRRFRLGRGRLLAGIAAAGVAASAAAALALTGFPGTGHGPARGGVTAASSALPASEGSPSRIGAVAATPIPRGGHAKHSPPLLTVRIPGGPPSGRDGQALFLSAAQQGASARSRQPASRPPKPRGKTEPAPARAGTLSVSRGTLNLGTGSTGTIVLTADGGPVSWSASSSSNLVELSSTSGSLSAGESVTVTVTLARHTAGGSATIAFGPGAEHVQVTWASRPAPAPSPSSGDTGSPQPAPPGSPSVHHRRSRSGGPWPRRHPAPETSSAATGSP